MKEIFIIIVNFNSQKTILDCLSCLKYERAETIVIDNASTDNSLSLIKRKFPQVKIIENKSNLGFSAACNIGIKYALRRRAQRVLLLNPDTLPEKDFLEKLSRKQSDIVSPILKFKRGETWVYDLGGKINWLIGRPYHQESYSSKTGKPKSIDYVSGCCMLIKKEVFNEIGFFDERFFLFFEDVDFCLRAKKRDLKIDVSSNVIVWHKLSEGKKKGWFYHYQILRSNFIFFNKWLPLHKKPLAYGYLLLLGIKIIFNKLF